MMNLKNLSMTPSRIIPKWIILLFMAVSIIGFADATYLTVKHYDASSINCAIGGGCEQVTASQYSTVGGIPISIFGAAYYLSVFILLILYFDTGNFKFLYSAASLTLVGLAVSVLLVALQLFVIKAICFYCMISALSSITLFVLGLAVKRYKPGVFENSR